MLRLTGYTAQLHRVGVFIASLFVVARALAMPISYSEEVSGDLIFPAPAFALDAGSNRISGTTHFSVNSPGRPRFDTDFDSFAFILPTGLQLVGISLSFATTAFNVAGADLELRLCRDVIACGLDPLELLGIDAVDLLGASPRAVEFGRSFPVAAGVYSLFTSGIGLGVADVNIPQASWFSDYSWTLMVERVAEPSVLGLLVLGLVALVSLRRCATVDATGSHVLR